MARIDLSYADLKYPPPDELIEALHQELSRVNLYPSGDYGGLREAYAGYAGVDKANVLPGNGGDEIIDLITRVWGDRVLLAIPTYSQYALAAKRRGSKIILANSLANGQYLIAFSKGQLGESSLIWICNPNNPTGNKIPRQHIISVLRETHAMVAVDECYYEFSGESVVDLIDEFDNLVVMRSLSKNFGLAGLRLGFALSAVQNIEKLEQVRQIFSVNRLAERAGKEIFDHFTYYRQIWDRVAQTRETFIAEVSGLGLTPFKSYTNFVLVKFSDVPQMENVWQGLRDRGIDVLKADDEEEFTGLDGPLLRFTIGTDDEMRKVTQAMAELLRGEDKGE